MVTRRFFYSAAMALVMTLTLPLGSGRANAWADGREDRGDDRQRDEDRDEDREKVTICEHGKTEHVTRRELPKELREGATLGKCHGSPQK